MPLDNRKVIEPFIPETFDGDTFYYTEILDRSKRSGNNRGRRLREFVHRDRATFVEQCDQIAKMCEFFQARAYTRLSPRSFRLVGMKYVQTIVEQALTANWQGMRHAYAKAMGTTPPLEKRWLFDADDQEQVDLLAGLLPAVTKVVARVPSRKGVHFITQPFDMRSIGERLAKAGIEVHKDNPTNLYVPDGAA